MDFSVTITTCNRADSLRRGLEALAQQDYEPTKVEIIVSDNGSTDHTKDVADACAATFANFHYIYDARPGQLVGWHRALAVANGTITCFIDDDVRPHPGWLSALAEAYRDPRVALATGPIELGFEHAPPDWLATMTLGDPGGQTVPLLGGLDCGPHIREIPGNFVWGTNFSVRRDVLLDIGGFHPCAMPWRLIHFHGDGEIHVGRSAQQRGHKILYHPKAAVTHDISDTRLTLESVARKFTTTGCTRSFQTLRANPQVYAVPAADEIRMIAQRYFREPAAAPADLIEAVESGLDRGINMQRNAYMSDAQFRDFVLRNSYLDLDSCYTHPDIAAAQPSAAADWRSGV